MRGVGSLREVAEEQDRLDLNTRRRQMLEYACHRCSAGGFWSLRESGRDKSNIVYQMHHVGGNKCTSPWQRSWVQGIQGEEQEQNKHQMSNAPSRQMGADIFRDSNVESHLCPQLQGFAHGSRSFREVAEEQGRRKSHQLGNAPLRQMGAEIFRDWMVES